MSDRVAPRVQRQVLALPVRVIAMPADVSRSEPDGLFAAAMDRLGPFEPCPRLAVAVSGGADSMALVLLAAAWVEVRGGAVIALTVDHGLRPESSGEADATLRSLHCLGVAGRKLTVEGLARGPALAERAREARYRLLLNACAAGGFAHLLLGHHAGDQVETVMMRALSLSGERGLAGMPALTETRFVRLVRPLLAVAPGSMRAWLTARGIGWIEDPSNRDPAALRTRLRAARADPSGTAPGTQAVARAAIDVGKYRALNDARVAQVLAGRATIRPEGFAFMTPGPIEPSALAALLRAISGTQYAAPIDRVARLARSPGPATLGGVRIVPAGRLGPGWLLVRERRAMASPVNAELNVVWDGRFRLAGVPPDALPPRGSGPLPTVGALGQDAARYRNRNGLPTLVLHGLPALRLGGMTVAVPHIGEGDPRWLLLFDPRNSAAGAPFLVGAELCGSRFLSR